MGRYILLIIALLQQVQCASSLFHLLFKPNCRRRQKSSAYACSDSSNGLEITYPSGVMSCGAVYSIDEAQAAPKLNVKVELPDSGELYTLLLVDTDNDILHYGAVNVEASSLSNLDVDSLPQVFSSYRGPAPPRFLRFSRRIYRRLFSYEWILTEQTGEKSVPSEENFRFPWKDLIRGDKLILTSYFSSGFCAK